MSLALFNPSIASGNVGDSIIIDAVLRELSNVFPDESVIHIPTQDVVGSVSKRIASECVHRFVGGTNLLSSQMLKYKQWKINIFDSQKMRDITLMGVGWWQYQKSPDLYTSVLLRRVLSKKKIHSVRDEYTKVKLSAIGITNVLNTGCPTMWGLTSEHCAKVSNEKAASVVFTLTDYKRLPHIDRKLIDTLKKMYKTVYFWPQGTGDLKYIHSLSPSGVRILPMTLSAFNTLLDSETSLDFVGTRLHGGVRALQKKRRTLILAVDNRAREISKDTKLPVVEREDFEAIENWIQSPCRPNIKMDFDAINSWRRQFISF